MEGSQVGVSTLTFVVFFALHPGDHTRTQSAECSHHQSVLEGPKVADDSGKQGLGVVLDLYRPDPSDGIFGCLVVWLFWMSRDWRGSAYM